MFEETLQFLEIPFSSVNSSMGDEEHQASWQSVIHNETALQHI